MAVGEGNVSGYEIRDEQKLLALAMDFGVEIGDRSSKEIAADLGRKALDEFGRHSGEITFIKRAPRKRQEIWRKNGVVPRGIDREIVELMHRTHAGVDMEYHHLLQQGIRVSLADGWGGSMIATELQDVLFGTPTPALGQINLGVLKEDEVNVIIHGHEPLLSEVIVAAAHDPEIMKLANRRRRKGDQSGGSMLYRQRNADAARHPPRR